MGRSGARSTDVQASGAGFTASRTGDSHVNSKVNSAAKANHQSNPTVGRMDVGSKASRHVGSPCSLSHCPALEYGKIGTSIPRGRAENCYSFTTSICLSSTSPVNRSIATCTQ